MPKITYSQDIKEMAFLFWYECRNDSSVVRMLKSEGYNVTRATVTAWRQKYDWSERAANVDMKKQAAMDTGLSFEESLLVDLEKQKKRYDVYFDNLEPGTVDNQAMYVYNQLCEKLITLKNKIKPQAKNKRQLNSENIEEIKKQILGLD